MNKEEKIRELELINEDFTLFLKYVKIQEPGELAVEWVFWPHLLDFIDQLGENNLIDLIKSKQIGISWILAAYALWKIYTIPGWNVLELSKGLDEAKKLLDKSRIIYNNLPDWMLVFDVLPDSAHQFGFKKMKSVITAFPSTETAGIGETAGTVIHDESDFHEFYEVNLSHTRATVADSKERQLISVSTVDKTKPDSYFKNHWKDADAGKNGFKALFYGWDVRPNRDDEWYQVIVKENEERPWVVKGNYPKTAKEALEPLSAISCFNADVMTRMWDDASYGETEKGFIHIFCPFVVGTHYSAGIDVGEGVGLDYSVFNIVGKQGLMSEVAAVIYSNSIGTDAFAYECYQLGEKYGFPRLVVDNIGIGRAVIDKLIELGYPNLYYTKNDKGENKKCGWALTRPNKRELVVKLVERVNNGSLITGFKPQVQEMMEYQWINGYPEPVGKTHGDTVISLMFANIILDDVGPLEEASMWIGGKQIF